MVVVWRVEALEPVAPLSIAGAVQLSSGMGVSLLPLLLMNLSLNRFLGIVVWLLRALVHLAGPL